MSKKKLPTRCAIVTHYDEATGNKLESVYFKEGSKIRHRTYINGEHFGYKTDTVYKAYSDEPYIRECGHYWKITGDDLLAVRSLTQIPH